MSHQHDHLPGVNGAMDRRLWASAALNLAITLAELFGGLLAEIKDFLHDRWGVAHATLEPEVEGCGETAVIAHWHDEGADGHIG